MQGVVRLLQGVVRLLPFKPVALIALGARSRTTNHSTPLPQETLYRCLLLCVSCCVVFSVLLPIGLANVFAMLGVQGASLEHVCQHSRRKQDEQMQPAKRQHHGKCDLDGVCTLRPDLRPNHGV